MINDTQTLKKVSRHGFEVPIYDDGLGPLFVLRNSTGIAGIVRARTWEDAYSICEDEFFPEADETIDDFRREYGFRRERKQVVRGTSTTVSKHLNAGERFAEPGDYPLKDFIRWALIVTPDPDAWPENELFQESFGFRPNGSNQWDKHGHGIYARDINGEYLDLLTPRLAEELDLEIELEETC
jgi:hypothetical protein